MEEYTIKLKRLYEVLALKTVVRVMISAYGKSPNPSLRGIPTCYPSDTDFYSFTEILTKSLTRPFACRRGHG